MKKNPSRKWNVTDIAFIITMIAFLLKIEGAIAVSGWVIFAAYELIAAGYKCANGKWNEIAWCMEAVTVANALRLFPHPWAALGCAFMIDYVLAMFSDKYLVQTNKIR